MTEKEKKDIEELRSFLKNYFNLDIKKKNKIIKKVSKQSMDFAMFLEKIKFLDEGEIDDFFEEFDSPECNFWL